MGNILGLDLGTNSIGYVLVNEKYTPVRHKGKIVTGVFKYKENEISSNQERRSFRTSRRALRKRHDRIRLLDSIFSSSDKEECKYETIWHLQKAIILGEETKRSQLYALIKSLFKHRGNFYELRPNSLEEEILIKKDKLSGFENVYDYKINSYNIYKQNLKILKNQARKNNSFNQIFKGKNCLFNQFLNNDIDLETFFKKSNLSYLDLPKQRIDSNAQIPNWIHEDDLILTLKSFNKHSKEPLSNNDTEKIINIFTFTVPFYVGPYSGLYSWCIKDNNGNIDNEATMRNFIQRMTSNCTYLSDEKALPKQSLINEMVQLLNQLNVITINGNRINKEQKLFLLEESKKVKLTEKSIVKKLLKAKLISADDIVNIPALTNDIKTYRDLSKILGDKFLNNNFVETIIKECAIFNSDKNYLRKVLSELNIGEITLTNEQVEEIIKLNINGWSRLSKKFLLDSTTDLSENKNIFNLMYDESKNLQEVIFSYGFDKLVKLPDEFSFDIIDNANITPSAKKTTRKAIKLIQDLKNKGLNIDKICIESTRTNRNPKELTKSRLSELKKLYKNNKKILKELEVADLKDNKVYLYYKQKGRCLYSGEKIILDNNIFDKDHIYPQSKLKDDSVHNNLVLVKKTINISKSNNYPLDPKIQDKMRFFWKELLDEGFISNEKYLRLIRTEPLTQDELQNFVNAQIISTSQANKFTKDIIEKYFNIPVVFIKAENVSDFRYARNRLGEPYQKDRDINDFHHAHDAYFTAIVGNVFDERLTKKFFKKNTNISNVFKKEDEFWNNSYLKKISKFLNMNIEVIEEVREGRGKLFNTTIISPKKQKEKTFYLPLKKNQNKSKGAYASAKISYFSVVDLITVDKKGKEKSFRALLPIPIVFKDKPLTDIMVSELLCKKTHVNKVVVDKIFKGSRFNINGVDYVLKSKTGDYIICKDIKRNENTRVRFDSL